MADDDGSKSLISIDDLSGLGGVAKKVLDAVEKAIGALYRPRAIQKEAAAQAVAKRLLAQGQADANKIIAEADIDIWERVQARLGHQEVRRQRNIDNVVLRAIEHATKLSEEEAQPNDIDEDWMAQFLNRAQDVGQKEMQEVWGRILAREAAAPGSFGFRSLEALSRMMRSEAETFQKACYLSSNDGNIFKLDQAMSDFLTDEDILALRSAGLLHDGDFLSASFSGANNGRYGFRCGSMGVVVSHDTKKDFDLAQYLLTPVGRELAQLIDPKPNMDFFAALKAHLEPKKFKVTFLDGGNKEVTT